MDSGLVSRKAGKLSGDFTVPGDKSVSHRSLMLGALAIGETRIDGLLEAEDVLRTADAVSALGAGVRQADDGSWRISGVGIGGLAEPEDVIDLGNSGTGVRLLMGMLATHPGTSILTGDTSLRGRPMGRVIRPLEEFGARFHARAGDRLPVTMIGTADPVPQTYRLPVASAQVKSAVLLAGLNTPGRTSVIEPRPTRDHTELMLRHFGAEVTVDDEGAEGRVITVTGQPELLARDLIVPGDISSAAFPLVAALIVGESDLMIRGVGLNPLRTGILDTLGEMGACLSISNRRTEAGEPIGDISVRAGPLRGIDVPAERAPSMIDEYPVLAVAAAFAEGTTRLMGLSELRVKESDRLSAIADGLAACGARVEIEGDMLIVHGNGRTPAGGGRIAVKMDHRIAMAFLVLGTASDSPVSIDDADAIATSFPNFTELMNGLGADIGKDGAGQGESAE
ncbi:MAG: 3-phosphoshikimate 1-carboxyvinyltransferase [Rhodospirillales bacterium]|nr:3-phosphoshikimate 1-carboxyvinyltransferase [Rhodospirillales bacterium]